MNNDVLKHSLLWSTYYRSPYPARERHVITSHQSLHTHSRANTQRLFNFQLRI